MESGTAGTMSRAPQTVANYLKAVRSANLSDDPFEDGKRAAAEIMANVVKARATSD